MTVGTLLGSRFAVTLAGGAVLVLASAAPASATGRSATVLPGSVPPAAQPAARIGAVPAAQRLTIQLWLKPELASAAQFATAVATPGSPQFHHYLSPDAYTARFGAPAASVSAVTAWLRAGGLTQVRLSSGHDYVSASGPVSRVQAMLGVHLDRYRVASAGAAPTVVQANDRAVSVPASLAPDLLGVTGLGGASSAASSAATAPSPVAEATPAAGRPAPTCARYWAQYVPGFRPSYRGLSKGSLPSCGYSAAQLRAAYGATGTSTGQGQTVALTEDEAPTAMAQALRDYAASNHLPAPRSGQFRQIQGAGGSCAVPSQRAAQATYSDEAEMDSEAVYAMAPGASQLMIIRGGCDEDQGLLDAVLTVLHGNGHHPSASIVSNSWQIPEGEVPTSTVHAVDVRAAAEGVGLYFSSGDTPGISSGGVSGIPVTAEDPYVVAVGGTTLGLGARNNRLFEAGWSDDSATLDGGRWTDIGVGSAAGGGTSQDYAQPAYQKGVVPPSMSRLRDGKRTLTQRAVPDIAADADLDSGMLTGYLTTQSNGRPGRYVTMVNAGTSLACPLVAGLVADAQQGQRVGFGFLDPLLYRLARTRAFHDVLPVNRTWPQQTRAAYTPASGTASAGVDVFDAQDRAYTDQVTADGYDTMTGIGTPDGTAFLTGLRRAAATR